MFIPSSMEAIKEAYTGSSRHLTAVEDNYDKLIRHIKTEKIGMNIDLLNNSKYTHAIEKHLEAAFGTTVRFRWDGAMLMNAYTVMTSIYIDKKIHIYINPSLVTIAGLGAKELTAITLHEVGHNHMNAFLDFLSTNYVLLLPAIANPALILPLSVGALIGNVLMAPVGRVLMMARTKLVEYMYKYMKPVAQLYDIFRTFSFKADKVLSPFMPPVFMAGIAQTALSGNLMNVMIRATNPFRYVVEKESDRFAVEHGYGPALMSGLNKLTDMRTGNPLVKDAKHANPILDLVYDHTQFVMDTLGTLLGAYPSNQNRMRTAIDTLRAASTNPDLPPDLRKAAKNELQQAEEWYYEYYINLQHDEKKYRFFTTMNNIMLEKLFGGKADIREFMLFLTKPLHRK